MSYIPNFKSNQDWEDFCSLFDKRWHCKKALLDRVKDDMFPGYKWVSLPPSSIETINDIVQSLLYDVDVEFKSTRPEYKTADDEVFIPYRTFKESVLEALNEALTPYELKYKNECDTLACADHLTDE